MADWHLWLPPALTKRRFRIYTAGHVVSVTGGWIQQVALAWLVFRLTNSIFLLGLAGFLLNIFYLFLGPVSGLAADRLPRLPTLVAIDLVLAALALLLAAMGLANVENINAYLAVAALIGIVNAFEMPMRQTLFKDIVEERALVTSAIGVSAMVFNVGRMVGPAVAGVLLVYISEAWCFAINALSYLAIIGALLAMRLPRAMAPAATGTKAEGFWANLGALVDGLHRGDFAQISRALEDTIAEPRRASLVPGLAQIKGAATEAGALGCSLSGSGPSLFALCPSPAVAEAVAAAMTSAVRLYIGGEPQTYISSISRRGAHVTSTCAS